MWVSKEYVKLLEDERQRLLNALDSRDRQHTLEVQGFRRYIDQLLRRLFEKTGVPSPEPRPSDIPEGPFDPFTDIEETEEDQVLSKELDEFAR